MEIHEIVDKYSSIIDIVVTSDRKSSIENFFNSKVGMLFFEAPASSRSDYHNCFPGGLALHSLNVYKNVKKLNKLFEYNLDEESMFVISAFHDVGKACATNLAESHYIQTGEAWKNNRGILYEKNSSDVYMTNHLRSIFILQSFGIKLTADEFQAIYLNDGQYLQENRPYALKECPMALCLHHADIVSVNQEKNEQI